jgi:hypothetical protein
MCSTASKGKIFSDNIPSLKLTVKKIFAASNTNKGLRPRICKQLLHVIKKYGKQTEKWGSKMNRSMCGSKHNKCMKRKSTPVIIREA